MMSVVGYSGSGRPMEKHCQHYDVNIDPDLDDENAGKETIHSGHFMVSDIDDSAAQEEDEAPSLVVHESDCDQDTPTASMDLKDYVFETECKETSRTYKFGPQSTHTISIDASLTKLFECMSLAYSGKLTSPRWKQFKGLKLRLKDKIRLNNIIWRAWHIQFVAKKKPPVCQFASPLDVDVHYKPEALLLEGKYWKRQAASVTAEYKKWRMYYKGKSSKACLGDDSDLMDFDWDLRWPNSCLKDDDFMDFTDTLFSSSHQPFEYREIAKAGLADFIQPGLGQLQPALDDFADTFEPLQDFLFSRLPPLPEEGPAPDFFFNRPQASSTFSSLNNCFTSANSVARQTSDNTAQFLASQSGSTLMGPSHVQRPVSALLDAKAFNNTSFLPVLLNTPKSSISTTMEQSLSLTSSLIASPSLPVNRPPPGPSLFAFQTNQKVPEVNRNYPMASLLTAQGNMLPRGSTLLNSALAQVPMLKSQPIMTKPQRKVAMKPSPMKTSEPVLLKHGASAKPYPTFQMQTPSSGEFAVPSPPKDEVTPARTRRTGKDSPSVRRHSYAHGQQQQHPVIEILPQTNTMSVTSNAVPNESKVLTSDAQFAVPKVQPKPRLRSRSMSSPQNSSNQVLLAAKPTQAISLTNISATTPKSAFLAMASSSSMNSMMSMGGGQLTASQPQLGSTASSSAVLARLLTSGTSFSHPDLSSTTMTPVISSSPAAPTVTIISSMPASNNTLVISPLKLTAAITTLANEREMQKHIVMNPLRPIFTSPIAPRITMTPSKISSSKSENKFMMTDCYLTSSWISPYSTETKEEGQRYESHSGGASPPPLSLSSPPPPLASPGPSAEPGTSHGAYSKAFRPKSDEERVIYKEHRRVCHINAEQKRRCNIKHGFEALHHLLPSLCQNPNSKVSKAAMLQKSVDYIRTLKTERQQQLSEMEMLKAQIESLNQTISVYQSQLPATGAPVPCQRNNQLKERFEEHVRTRTLQNWKYWVFSLIMEPLLESYNTSVNSSSMDELCNSLLAWLEKDCSLVALRPVVLSSLRQLSTKTNILTQPSRLPEEATRAVTKVKEDR